MPLGTRLPAQARKSNYRSGVDDGVAVFEDAEAELRRQEAGIVIVDTHEAGHEGHGDLRPMVVPHERDPAEVGRQVAGGEAGKTAAGIAPPVEVLTKMVAPRGGDVGDEGRAPAVDVGPAGATAVLVDALPELVIGFGTGLGGGDFLEHREKILEVGLEALEFTLGQTSVVDDEPPVAGAAGDAHRGNAAEGGPLQAIVIRDHVEEEDQQGGVRLLGGGGEARQHQVDRVLGHLGGHRLADQVDGPSPLVAAGTVDQRGVANIDCFLGHRGGEVAAVALLVQPHMDSHFVGDKIPGALGAKLEADMVREAAMESLEEETGLLDIEVLVAPLAVIVRAARELDSLPAGLEDQVPLGDLGQRVVGLGNADGCPEDLGDEIAGWDGIHLRRTRLDGSIGENHTLYPF